MNTSNVQVLNTPSQMVKDLKDLDVAILNSTLINTPESIVITMNHLYAELSKPGVDKNRTNSQIGIMREILNTKIMLTQHVLGVNGNTHAFISNSDVQTKIDFIPQPIEKPVIVEGFKVDTNSNNNVSEKGRVIQMVAIAKNDLPFFEGYVRKTVLGSATELPKEAQELLAKYHDALPANKNTTSIIDRIIKLVTKAGQYEDALNLMIDLRTKIDTKVKIETIEKEFLFQILPWVLEVGVEPKDSMQNVSLAMWIDQLKQKKLPANSTNQLHEVVKEIPGLSASSATPEGCTQLITTITEGVVTKTEDTNLSEDTKKIQELETTVIENLNKGMATGKAMKDFYTKVRSIVSFDKNKDLIKETWNKCLSTWKDGLQTKAEAGIETIETKDTIVEVVTAARSIEVKDGEIVVDAETNINNKEEIIVTPEDQEYAKAEFEQAAKALILASLSDPTINTKNEFDKLAKKAGARKMFKDLNVAYKAWRTDIIAANPGLLEERKIVVKKPLFKVINIAEKHPDVWETARLTKNLEEFKEVLVTIVFNKTKELPNGWIIAGNLVDQYINNFEETKSLEADAKTDWFQLFMETKTKERKEAADKKPVAEETIAETTVVEVVKSVEEAAAVIVEEKKPVVVTTTIKPFDTEKYKRISEESHKSRLNALVGDFLLESSHGTLESRKIELVTLLKQNSKYTKSKDLEIMNYINKVATTNGAISKLA